LLEGDAVKTTGNEFAICDWYDGTAYYGSNMKQWYIDADRARYNDKGELVFQYVKPDGVTPNGRSTYVWEKGTHTFFGWLAKDYTKGIDVVDFFKYDFIKSTHKDTLALLKIPAITIDENKQFDFLYSRVVQKEASQEKPDPGSVEVKFYHFFTAVSLSILNETGSEITVKGLKINNVQTTQRAEIRYPVYPAGAEKCYAQSYHIPVGNTKGTLTFPVSSQKVKPGETYQTSYIMTWNQDADIVQGISFYIETSDKEYKDVALPSNLATRWIPGNKYNYTLKLQPGEEPGVELSSNVTVSDWGQTGVVGDPNAEGSGDFFFVDRTNIVLDNRNSAGIRVTSSGPWKYEVLSATYPVYYKDANGDGKDDNSDTDKDNDYIPYVTVNNYSISPSLNNGSLSNKVNQITLTNILDNNVYSSTFNYTPITFVVKAGLVNDSNNYIDNSIIKPVTITITQNPAVYVVADKNSDADKISVNRFTATEDQMLYGGNTYSHFGYVFVNGYYGYHVGTPTITEKGCFYQSGDNIRYSGENNLIGVSYFGDSGHILDGSNAPFMYVISVSDLSSTGNTIGDPRTINSEVMVDGIFNADHLDPEKTPDGKKIITWANCNSLYGNSPRKLTHYYPTAGNIYENQDSQVYNMISPKFRISSGFGATGDQYGYPQFRRFYDGAKARCASYQEDGRPAGRWRLPTKAEIEYVNTLSSKGLLYPIFNDIYYWNAHGIWSHQYLSCIPNISDNGAYGSISVRCVYDEWYWEQIDKNDPHFEQNENGFYLLKDGDGVNDLDGSADATDTENYRAQFFWGDRPR
jgi:hypothetical protein